MKCRVLCIATCSVVAVVSIACTSVPTFSAAIEAGRMDAAPVAMDGASVAEAGVPDAGSRKYGLFVTSAAKLGSHFGAKLEVPPWQSANILCNELARAAGYSESWLGLIRVKGAPLPKDLVGGTRSGGWFQTLGSGRYGDPLLTSLRDDGRTSFPILTEKGNLPIVDVWTGGSLSGSEPSDNCENWTKADAGAVSGSVTDPNKWMSNSASGGLVSCQFALAIYCIEQPLPP